MKNQLSKIVDKLNKRPKWLRYRLLSFALGYTVKFIGTAGVKCLHLSAEKSVFQVKNRRRVRNHIGSVHAAATALVVESATGMALAMHIPDGKIPVIKTMHIDYTKRSTGSITATARISEEQIEQLHSEDRGSIIVQCEVLDDNALEPVQCQMEWAWTPARRT